MANIDFQAGGNLFGGRKSFKQFELEAGSLLLISYDLTSTGTETAYTVTTGKTLFITQAFLINDSVSTNNAKLLLDDVTVYTADVPAHKTETITYSTPIPLTSGKTIKVDMNTADAFLVVIGWEV